MNLFQKIAHRGKRLLNSNNPRGVYEPNVHTYGEGLYDGDMVDLAETVPYIIKPSVRNFRFTSHDPFVRGLLIDHVTKSNTSFHINGSSKKAENYIKKCDKKHWNLTWLMDNTLMNGMIDGDVFYQIYYKNDVPIPRQLAYDGIKYRIKVINNDYGQPKLYKHLTMENKNSTNVQNKKYEEIEEDLQETENKYFPDEFLHCKYMEQYGKGRSLVANVTELVYYKRVLQAQMPMTAFKANNILKLTVGNETKPGLELSHEDSENIAETSTDYHKKGMIELPFGVDADILTTGQLPDIPSYLRYYDTLIFRGLSAPESTFSSESSNRSTAQVQMDSPVSGQILFYQYNQEWLKTIFERNLFRKALDEKGMEDEDVWMTFDTINDYFDNSLEVKIENNTENDSKTKKPQNLNNYDKYNNPYRVNQKNNRRGG